MTDLPVGNDGKKAGATDEVAEKRWQDICRSAFPC
jgi:hypothetical protein